MTQEPPRKDRPMTRENDLPGLVPETAAGSPDQAELYRSRQRTFNTGYRRLSNDSITALAMAALMVSGALAGIRCLQPAVSGAKSHTMTPEEAHDAFSKTLDEIKENARAIVAEGAGAFPKGDAQGEKFYVAIDRAKDYLRKENPKTALNAILEASRRAPLENNTTTKRIRDNVIFPLGNMAEALTNAIAVQNAARQP